MEENINILQYWPLFIATIPLAVALFSVTLAPFMTVKGKKAPLKKLVRFALVCAAISGVFLLSATLIQTLLTVQNSTVVGAHAKELDFDVYKSKLQSSVVELNSRTLIKNNYGYKNTNQIVSSGYSINERYQYTTGTNSYNLYQLNSDQIPESATSSCMPIKPRDTSKSILYECVKVGKNSEGSDIYVARKENRNSKSEYVYYSYAGISTTYGHTRVTIDGYHPGWIGKDYIRLLSEMEKVSKTGLRYFEFESKEDQPFLLPSLF